MTVREIVVRRSFRHPPERVWRAWTDPARLAKWFGPNGFLTETSSFDFRVGGEWVFTLAHDVHGTFRNRVRFQLIDAPHRLEYEHCGATPEESFQVEVSFVAVPGGTVMTMRSIFPTAEARRRVAEEFGAIEGARQTLSRLEAFLGREPKVRVAAFSLSFDGFGAGPEQDLDNPLGRGGMALHEWFLPTRTFVTMHGSGDGGTTGIDDDYAARSFAEVGAWILGRNMFGPIRGPWPDEAWKGWWGDEPPYRCPVFVLTHHERPALEMAGGTTFHFVTDGIEAALTRAREAAQGADVRIGGGVTTIRQYLQAGLIDELHLAVTGALLGSGESLLAGIDLRSLGFTVTERATSPSALHLVLTRD